MFKLLSFVHNERKIWKHERSCKDHDFCYPRMSNEDNLILKYIPGEKSLKVPLIVYSDLECLLQKKRHIPK